MSRVFIERFDKVEDLKSIIADALKWVKADLVVQPGSHVFIKPNLTWRIPTPGVTVTPAFLRALVENFLPLKCRITVGESEGGQACFQAEDAFRSHGLYELEEEYGISVVNLSKGNHEVATAIVDGRPESVELPSVLLHDVDIFVTVPVPKIHALTGVSLGFKNQWGCLGNKMRVTQHPHFGPSILAINKLLKPRLCIFDGTYFLDYTGPMLGKPVPMNLVIAGDDVGVASLACCEIMKIDPLSIAHLRLAWKEGMFPTSLSGVMLNRCPREFAVREFKLHRAFINYIQLAAFKNRSLNALFYNSKFADFLHEFLWFIRRVSIIRHMLYGKYGTGEAKRGG